MRRSPAEITRTIDRQAVLVAVGYTCVSLLWIWGSDWLVSKLGSPDTHSIQLIQSFKGSAFVITCGAALFATIAWSNARQFQTLRDKQLVEDMLAVSERLEGLGTLAGTLAHDFNNLLTVIRCEIEIMQLEDFDSAEIPQHIKNINLATERADHMVRELMLFMRSAPTAQQVGDLGLVVRDCAKFLQQAAGRDVALEIRTSPSNPPVAYDKSQIERALLNLVINAKDALHDRSPKRVVVESAVQSLRGYRSLFRSIETTGTFVVLTVTDNGCGIEREQFARIFSPFFSTKPPGKGTGLGLTSVIRVMQAHNGWVEVSSEVGKGSTFSLFFPAHQG